MASTRANRARDWVSRPGARLLLWDGPKLVLLASFLLDDAARTVLWPVCFAWMGIACLANARRCGRRHCHYTGPFYLLMALASLLHGLGIVPLGPHGWVGLAVVFVVVGYGLLWLLPERVWGRFMPQRQGKLP